jgi:hypothetical protein
MIDRSYRIARVIGPLILLALTLLVFGDVLFHPANRVIGSPSGDVASHSLWWHDLGWRELAHGHLTLWNPYVYGGSPFHAGFAAALLYPPLWIGLLLPVHVALNWHFASHVFLAGLFTYLYCSRSRGLSYAASTLGGAMFMFSGAFFLHTYPGHPTAIAAMTWLPLIVLGFDRFVVTRRWRWLILAAAAAAMQIYGGQVQYFYYTAIAMGMYAVLYAIAASLGKVSVSRGRWRDILTPLCGYGAIYVGSVLLSAPQLFPAFEAKAESVRGGAGVPIEYAATFSLPPENLATLFAPSIFTDGSTYFGRIYFWEACIFVGVSGLVLAAYALLARARGWGFATALVVFTLLLGLGYHTPLFRLLYDWFPGYNTFRGTSKFTFLTGFFLATLAAVGLDRIERATFPWRRALTLLVIPAALLIAAVVVRPDPTDPAGGTWSGILRTIAASGESEARGVDFTAPEFIRVTGMAASDRLLLAAGTAAVAVLMIWFRSRTRYAIYGLVGLCLIELTIFARSNVITTAARPEFPKPWANLLRDNPGDYRVLLGDVRWANWGTVYGFQNIYGYDSSSITRRFADFLAHTQGVDPDQAQQYFRFTQFPPYLSLLRTRFALIPEKNRPVVEIVDPLPHALLIPDYVIGHGRDDVLERIAGPSFDPRKVVVLESEPAIKPQPGGESGTVEVDPISTDELHIRATVPAPTILLVTDNYSRLWRAAPLSPGPQATYDVLPANWVLRAIPLQAGTHHIRLRYAPRGVPIGFAVTGITLAGLVGAGIWSRRRMRFGSRLA